MRVAILERCVEKCEAYWSGRKAIDGEQSGSMGLEKDPGGWIGKRVVELGLYIGR